MGFVKCTLWLFLISNSRLLNAKCCFSALTQRGKVLRYKSAVGAERTGRTARRVYLLPLRQCCSEHRSKLFFQTAPWHRLFAHKWPQVIYLFGTAGFCKRNWAIPANRLILLSAALGGHAEFVLLQEIKTVAEIFKAVGSFYSCTVLLACLFALLFDCGAK